MFPLFVRGESAFVPSDHIVRLGESWIGLRHRSATGVAHGGNGELIRAVANDEFAHLSHGKTVQADLLRKSFPSITLVARQSSSRLGSCIVPGTPSSLERRLAASLDGSHITVNFVGNEVQTLVRKIRASMDEIEVGEGAKAEINADLATIETQLQSPHPKSIIISECLSTIKTILLGVVGSLIASELKKETTHWLFPFISGKSV